MSSGSPVSEQDDVLLKCLENLQRLRAENVEPGVFWQRYLEILAEVCPAQSALIAVSGAKDAAAWQPIAFHPPSLRSSPFLQAFLSRMEAAAEAGSEKAAMLPDPDGNWAAVRLKVGVESQKCLALFYFGEDRVLENPDRVALLTFLNDLPAQYQVSRTAQEAMARREQFAAVLDLMTFLNAQSTFRSAAMTFCNELAARHQCERVSLGWYKDGYVYLQVMSHVDDFDKKMEVVERLELAMEEAFDQDTEIILPASKDSKVILRDHEAYGRAQQILYLCSMPLRVEGDPVGICLFERSSKPFTDAELRLIRLSCDQAVRRLDDLKRQDQWWGRRLAAAVTKKFNSLLGYRYTGAKVLAVLGSIVLAIVCLLPVTYRLESPVILRTEHVSFLTAPFDGHIERVDVRVGDEVPEGGELLAMDQSDLLLEEAGLTAERNRYQRESEKARAANALADMRIAEALQEQAAARLDLVRHHLRQAVIRAPHAVIVVEGDLKERIGSPVKQGDILFKVGRTDQIYAELEVPESEIHHVKTSLNGEIALASKPQDSFKINVVRIEPSAVPKEKGNVFLVRCMFPEKVPEWWKPGLTGVSKLNAGKQTLLWIFTHRTIDFLRLKLWW